MYNPLIEEIENIESKVVGDMLYKGKKVVLLSDATEALEELERKLSEFYEMEINKVKREFYGKPVTQKDSIIM